MLTVSQYAEKLLLGPTLEDKCFYLSEIVFDDYFIPHAKIEVPGRTNKMCLDINSRKQDKFPKINSFHDPVCRAKALHFFANHELQAIEIMAHMLLIFPHDTVELKKFKRSLISTIYDEQKHLKLYISRMNEFGLDFGDLSLSDFFWRQCSKIDGPETYYAIMSMTFESANIDFAHFYKDVFKHVGDDKSEKLMGIVLDDEIKHVSLGHNYLSSKYPTKDTWELYCELLPWPLTPARAKGISFFEEARLKIGMPSSYIKNLKEYSDDFKITRRREVNAKICHT